jgi:hypothetical protein
VRTGALPCLQTGAVLRRELPSSKRRLAERGPEMGALHYRAVAPGGLQHGNGGSSCGPLTQQEQMRSGP